MDSFRTDVEANTIGLVDLLDEISRDLDEYRKKHAGDYSVKGVSLWWDVQRERLLLRHAPTKRVALKSLLWKRRRYFAWFLAGSGTQLVAQAAVWSLLN